MGFDALVDMLPIVTIGPAIKRAVFQRRHVIGNQVAAELVALIDDGPKSARVRLPGEPIWIAQPRGEDPVTAIRQVDLPNGGAVDFLIDAVFAHVAV